MLSEYELYLEERTRLMQAPLWRRLLAPVRAKGLLYSILAAEFAEGVDVSHWQGVIDWNKLWEKAAFAIIKATDGLATDSQFAVNAVKSEKPGKLRSFFHFLRPTPSGADQARYLIATCKDKAGSTGELPVMVDVETLLSWQVVKDFVFTAVGLTGLWPLIYCSRHTWEELVSGTKADKAFASACPLHVAHWGTLLPAIPYNWTDWVVQQYTSKGDGPSYGVSSTYIDLDRARLSWLNQFTTQPEDEMDIAKIKAELAKISVAEDTIDLSIQTILAELENATPPPIPPVPPTPPPPPPPTPVNVRDFRINPYEGKDKANARFIYGWNKADPPRPIFQIYPGDSSKADVRQQFDKGEIVQIVGNAWKGDSGLICYELYDPDSKLKYKPLFVRKIDGMLVT